ncbi:hypothetical protein FN846DRAFT_958803 [Sphaerosporella brunnea]|uniref:Wbp11/ELF5/Saf1 N-terminal domain-containing protein n=1 Tax=Sphaerosporella brunnea TaxID=1250544 RepID=A0A5J5ER64_9PEZI|nr:hypothetical protein FN846DRAFT_958803 [Sphaerosporella brunnea]
MQAWHKEQKAKAIKKNKAAQLKEKTEKLARRNPERLQRQVDELKEAIEAGNASAHNKKVLADLERDLAAVRRARKAMGIEDKEPSARGGQKRHREDGGPGEQAGGDWRARRRDARIAGTGKSADRGEESDSGESTASSVADIPLPPGPLPALPGEPKQEVKTTYEAAPVMRDLRKEAAAFVPVTVKRKLETQKASQQQKSEEDTAEGGGTAAPEEASVAQAAFVPRVNAAPEVDVDEEMRRFNVEIQEAADDGR